MNRIQVKSSRPPTVEIDTESRSAYIRFGAGRVVKTVPRGDGPGVVVTIDYDANDNVIGIELVGVQEFNVTELLLRARITVTIPKALLQRARYVSARVKTQLAAA